MAAQQLRQDPYTAYPEAQAGVSRPLTIDDVVTKTGITLGVIVAVACAVPPCLLSSCSAIPALLL